MMVFAFGIGRSEVSEHLAFQSPSTATRIDPLSVLLDYGVNEWK